MGHCRKPDKADVTFDDLRQMSLTADRGSDMGVFSSADAIRRVLGAVLGTKYNGGAPPDGVERLSDAAQERPEGVLARFR